MNLTISSEPPLALLQRLHDVGDTAAVAGPDRELAVGWLRRVLVDFDSLHTHVRHLMRLYDSPFCFPASRRDGGTPEATRELAAQGRFRFTALLGDERILEVFDGGVEVLDDQELGKLLLNPYALRDLFDAIVETSPDAWMPVMQQVGREMMRRENPSRPATPRSASLPPLVTPASIGRSPQEPPGRPLPWTGMGLLALAASVLVVGVSWLLMGGSNKGGSGKQLAELKASVSPIFDDQRGSKEFSAVEVHSNADSFVTLVVLYEKKREDIVPDVGEDDVPISAGASKKVPVNRGAKAVLALVSPVPLDDSVRKILFKKEFNADKIVALEQLLQTELAKKGFQQIVFEKLTVK